MFDLKYELFNLTGLGLFFYSLLKQSISLSELTNSPTTIYLSQLLLFGFLSSLYLRRKTIGPAIYKGPGCSIFSHAIKHVPSVIHVTKDFEQLGIGNKV